jgi:hypothetical protein
MQIPSFFTPATLVVVPSTMNTTLSNVQVPALDMITSPNLFVGFTPNLSNYTGNKNISTESLTFVGSRSILDRLANVAASSGMIPPITPPSNHSSYFQSFPGPYVKCEQANDTVAIIIQALLEQKVATLQDTYRETVNAYFSFVPSFDTDGNGTNKITYGGKTITALSEPRLQQPQNASNELWYTFMRYEKNSDGSFLKDANGSKVAQRQYSQCKLYHAIYDIYLQFDDGSQSITKNNITLLDTVDFPSNSPFVLTNLTQQSYSAYFSVLTDQVVGSMGFLNDTQPDPSRSPAYSQIDTPIIRNSLLGSDDLDFFFDTNKLLYLNNSGLPLSPQRLQDKALANNQTLPFLIEDLSFNITMSFFTNTYLRYRVFEFQYHDPQLTEISPNTTVTVEQISDVNRYAFNAGNLWIAYGLAILFSLVANVLGMIAFYLNDASHDMSLSTILSITRDRLLDDLFPQCAHGRLPLPKETMKTLLRIVRMSDDMGWSLQPPVRKQSLCPKCVEGRRMTITRTETEKECQLVRREA